MRIKYNRRTSMTLDQLADELWLTMYVQERERDIGITQGRYYCNFIGLEVKQGGVLVGEHGNGSTVDRAIRNYCKKISNKHLVFNANSKERYEMMSPTILPVWTEEEV